MSRKPNLAGKICIVTGATRGIGKGIALQLAEAGATVYVTGRTLKKSSNSKGSLEETAAEIESRGGRCIPVQCDHTKDDEIQKLFDQVKNEQNGQLDVLVNNAYSAVTAIGNQMSVPFWEQPLTMWDDVNCVGLRNHYICSVHASRLMVPRKRGLIVNISSAGGLKYLFNVPYGVGKEACDRMAADCAIELRKHNVAFISLWPGAVRTELVSEMMKTGSSIDTGKISHKHVFEVGSESTEFSGRCITYLASDPNIMKKSGRILFTADIADEYTFNDIDGKDPLNFRSISGLLALRQSWFASFFPRWIKFPRWMLAIAGSKF